MSKKQCDRLRFFQKDEKEANKEYLEWSKKKNLSRDEKKQFKKMAKDELKHKEHIDKMLKRRGC